jgi:uroporphyrinogen decarboxylase
MKEMTTHERMSRMYAHKEADRVPITDGPWGTAIERWRREGMPKNVSFVDFFGLDLVPSIGVDNSPLYPAKVLEETPEYVKKTTGWGVTIREWAHAGGVPEFLDFTIVDRESWAKAKARMTPSRDRVDWERLKREYPGWRKRGAWISTYWWFGFDVTHSWAVGTERILMAMATDPDWCVDMFNTFLDLDIAMFEMLWDEGFTFDEIHWPDDMGYKGTQFFSLDMYRSLLKPVQKRACDWAHKRGIKTHLHSCGNINAFVPDLIDAGIDMLNPLEVKAGMDPLALKSKYGDKLGFHGGINVVLFDKPDKLEAEMRRVVPAMKKGGGYWLSSDHSVPDSVSLEDFRRFVELGKKLGSYS